MNLLKNQVHCFPDRIRVNACHDLAMSERARAMVWNDRDMLQRALQDEARKCSQQRRSFFLHSAISTYVGIANHHTISGTSLCRSIEAFWSPTESLVFLLF